MRSHTIETLKKYRSLMSGLIQQHSGRVVDNPGDNLLAEFSSAVDAVECAVEVQKKLKKENAKFVEDMQLQFRIGVNIGDVVQDGDRIYGDGVNIAARIEGLADPAGICVSRNIYDQIKKKLGLGFEYIGEHSVKNISDPVSVYKVLMDPKDAGKRINEESDPQVKKSRLKKWLKITASIILILSAVLVGFYWKYIYLPAPADIDPEGKMEFNLPKGPSIAVLPFVNMSKDPEQEYLCDGLTENLISALAQVPQVLVISRNSTFAYKDKPIDARQIGQELGARYLIEGRHSTRNLRYPKYYYPCKAWRIFRKPYKGKVCLGIRKC
jgi:adenylate cyclase